MSSDTKVGIQFKTTVMIKIRRLQLSLRLQSNISCALPASLILGTCMPGREFMQIGEGGEKGRGEHSDIHVT